MIKQVSCFILEQVEVVVFGLNNQLNGFFTYLLGYFIHASTE